MSAGSPVDPSGHPDPRDQESVDAGAQAVGRLDAIARILRRECPWDRDQDLRSIVTHTVEEAYELADAIERGEDAAILDELGDILFQVNFLALLMEERGAGDLAAVADGCREKLVRRHPHVFADVEAERVDAVKANWDRIKRDLEGKGAEGVFGDVPEVLPALLFSRKAQRRAASRGGSRDSTLPETTDEALEGSIAAVRKLVEQGASGAPHASEPERSDLERAIGNALFAIVDLARRTSVDPELALRAETVRFMEDFGSDQRSET